MNSSVKGCKCVFKKYIWIKIIVKKSEDKNRIHKLWRFSKKTNKLNKWTPL